MGRGQADTATYVGSSAQLLAFRHLSPLPCLPMRSTVQPSCRTLACSPSCASSPDRAHVCLGLVQVPTTAVSPHGLLGILVVHAKEALCRACRACRLQRPIAAAIPL